MSSKIKVAILEDHAVVAAGYGAILQDAVEVEIVGVANVYSAWEPLLASQPVDIALMDVVVPTAPDNPNPYPILSLLPQLVETYPEMVFLVISAYAEPVLIQGVMEAGATGYVVKGDNNFLLNLKKVLVSIVTNRETYLSPAVKEILRQRQLIGAEASLTPRQVEVLTVCAANPESQIKDLAAQLNITYATLRNLLSESYLRLDVSGRKEAVLKAQQMGLLNLDKYSPDR